MFSLASPFLLTVLLGGIAGLSGTLGGLLAHLTHSDRVRHDFITAFGAGALLGAVGLVLLPHGIMNLPLWLAIFTFLAGGGVALLFERWTERHAEGQATLTAMLLDFLPEAIVVGALIPVDRMQAAIVAIIILAQNGPEGFAAYREMVRDGDAKSGWRALMKLALLPIIGILSVAFGVWLCELRDISLGLIMVGASGGILYLTFKKIIPESQNMEDGPWPAYGGVLGFTVALIGYGLTAH